MTTNAGAEATSRRSIGFQEQNHATDGMEAIRKLFTPEFRNRIDTIIQFNSLDIEVIKNVVDKFLVELQAQLDSKRVVLEVDKKARAWLAEEGYDEAMGARPMARLIQEQIKKPMAEAILFGELSHQGGTVHITANKKGLQLKFEAAVLEALEVAALHIEAVDIEATEKDAI